MILCNVCLLLIQVLKVFEANHMLWNLLRAQSIRKQYYIYTHTQQYPKSMQTHFDGLVQERCNCSALAMELRLSCSNPSICPCRQVVQVFLTTCPWGQTCCLYQDYCCVHVIWHCNNQYRIKLSTHKRHSIPCPHGQAMECLFLSIFGEKYKDVLL